MAEGYVISSAVDANDLLNQIVSQAALHGWTQHSLGGLGANGRRGHISRDGVTINLASATTIATGAGDTSAVLNTVIPLADRAHSNGTGGSGNWSWSAHLGGAVYAIPDVLCINASTGYDGAVNWYRQPGAPFQNGAPQYGTFGLIKSKGAIGKVHMFFYDNPAMIFVVAETQTGVRQWLCGGNLSKDYAFTGGQMYGASTVTPSSMSSDIPSQLDVMQIRVVAGDLETSALGNGWGSSMVAKYDRQVLPGATPIVGQRVPQYWVAHTGPTVNQFSDVVENAYDEPTGRIWFNPAWCYALRPNTTRSYIGELKHVHYSTVSRFPGEDLVTVGGVEYMIFPANFRPSPYDPNVTAISTSDAPAPYRRSGHYGSGFALRRPA